MTQEKIRYLIKVAIVFTASVVIWRIMMLLTSAQNFAANVFSHIWAGIFVAVLVSALIFVMFRVENQKLDLSAKVILNYLKNFSWGFVCWVIPSAITITVLAITGVIAVSIEVSPHTFALQIAILFIAVFLIEAFPEEIIRSYIYAKLEKPFSPWVALIVQTVLFTLFALSIGALNSMEQVMFIPGFGFLLCYFRMLSGNAFFSVGFHAAMMTASQALSPARSFWVANGDFFVIHLLSFIVIPAIVSSVLLHIKKSRG